MYFQNQTYFTILQLKVKMIWFFGWIFIYEDILWYLLYKEWMPLTVSPEHYLPGHAEFIKNDLLWLMCCKLVNLPRICEFDKTSHVWSNGCNFTTRRQNRSESTCGTSLGQRDLKLLHEIEVVQNDVDKLKRSGFGSIPAGYHETCETEKEHEWYAFST